MLNFGGGGGGGGGAINIIVCKVGMKFLIV